MKAGLINMIIALFMFGLAMYTALSLNDICSTVMNCGLGLLNAIQAAICTIIEKIDSHENKTAKETEERSEKIC